MLKEHGLSCDRQEQKQLNALVIALGRELREFNDAFAE